MEKTRKKNSRQRGTHTHGWGSKKKHRGAGSRGGRGNAGSGKRGDAKKPSFWKDHKRYGKSGFTSKVRNKYKTINISELDTKIDNLVKQEKVKLKNNIYTIDLANLKIGKLLGAGNTTRKFEIKVGIASAKAIAKIEKAGGKVILPVKNVKKEVKKEIKEIAKIKETTEVKEEISEIKELVEVKEITKEEVTKVEVSENKENTESTNKKEKN